MASFEEVREKYDEFIENLEEQGVPNPRVLIPAVVLVLIAGIAFLAYQSFAPGTQTVAFTITDAQGNAIPGLNVVLYDDEDELASSKSDDEGKVSFEGISTEARLRIRVTDANAVFDELDRRISFDTTNIPLGDPLSFEDQKEFFSVLVADENERAITGASVTLTMDDGTSHDGFSEFSGIASFVLPSLPNHVTVKVTASGFVDKLMSFTKADIEANGGTVRISLQNEDDANNDDRDDEDTSEPSIYGDVIVELVSADDGLPVSNAEVRLKSAQTLRIIRSMRTDDAGTALFQNVRIGSRFLVDVKKTGDFASLVTDEYVLQASISSLDIRLQLERVLEGRFIDLRVIDEDNAALDDAVIHLFDTTGKELQRDYADEKGAAVFYVTGTRPFHITAYSPGYLPANGEFFADAEPQEIVLMKETQENSVEMLVSVEEDFEPSDGAEISLFTGDGFFLGLPSQYSDAEGETVFTVPSGMRGPYQLFAKALKGTKSGESSRVSVAEGAELFIALEYEPGFVDVSLFDVETEEPIEEGAISAISSNDQIIDACDLGEEDCFLEVPAFEEFTVVATSPGYYQTSSVPLTVSPSEQRLLELQLVSESLGKSVDVKFLGAFNRNGKAEELGNAEHYLAKFLVTAPAQSTNVGFHVHLSNAEFISLEEPVSEAPVLYTAPIFDSASCYSESNEEDASEFVSEDLVFPDGFVGSKELAIKLYVKPEAPAATAFRINYKAYASKGGLMVTSPVQTVFEAGQAAPSELLPFLRVACGEKDFSQELKITAAPLICNTDASFCARIYLKSGTDVSRTSLEVDKGDDFTVHYDVLSTAGIDAISIRNAHSEFLGADATEFADEGENGALSSDAQRIPVAIAPDQKQGGTLNFKANKAVLSSDLKITFHSELQARSYDFNLKIRGSNAMQTSVSPLSLFVGEEKKIKINVIDEQGNGVEDAFITLYDCDQAPLAGEEPEVMGDGSRDTGERGSYRVSANPSNLGKIGVRVEHPDFRTFDACLIEVAPQDDSLELSPSFFEFNGDSSDPEPQRLTISSALGVKSSLNVYSNCFANDVPVLVMLPNSFNNFRDSENVDVSLLPDTTAKTFCSITAEQRISSRYTIVQSASVRIDVKGPVVDEIESTPTPTPTAVPDFPPVPNVVYLSLDQYGYADSYFSLHELGEVTSCTLTGPQDFLSGVQIDCTPDIVQFSADFSGQELSGGLRLVGRARLSLPDRPTRLITVIALKGAVVTAEPTDHGTPTLEPGECNQAVCPSTGTRLECCDTSYNQAFEFEECTSNTAWMLYTNQITLLEACSAPEPLCVIGVDPQVISEAGEILVSLNYYDLESPANVIAVNCGNGRTENAIGCTGSTGACTTTCYYSEAGTYEINAELPDVSCLNSMVEFLEGEGPTVTGTPTAIPEPDNPAIRNPVYLYLDENGFADAAYRFDRGEIVSCELRGPPEIREYLTLDCLTHTVVLTADYSQYEELTNKFRGKGSIVIQGGELQKTYTLVVSGARIPSPECKANPSRPGCPTPPSPYDPLPSSIPFDVDPHNRYFEYMFGLNALGEPVIGCEVHGLEPSIASWIQLQYCSAEDQRVRVMADFSGQDVYQRIIMASYQNNPYCAQHYGTPTSAGGSYTGNMPYAYAYGVGRPNDYPSADPYSYGADRMFQQSNYPQGYGAQYTPFYQNNPYASYPQGGVYDRYYNFPLQYSFYNQQNTYGYQMGMQFASGLPSTCIPQPLQGFLVISLESGITRRIPLIITARGVQPVGPPIPPQPYQPEDISRINSVMRVVVDPFSLNRLSETSRSFEGTDTPNCKLGFEESLFTRIQQGVTQRGGNAPQPSSSSSTYQPAVSLNLDSGIEAEELCRRDGSRLFYQLYVDLERASINARELQPGVALNRKEDAYVIEDYPRYGSQQLTPIVVQLGSRSQYDLEPFGGPLAFLLTSKNADIDASKDGKFKVTDDLLTNCQPSGLEDGDVEIQLLDGLPSRVDMDAEFKSGYFILEEETYSPASKEDDGAVQLTVPPKDATVNCNAVNGRYSSELHFASFADKTSTTIIGFKLEDYAVPMLGAFPNLPPEKHYVCELISKNNKVRSMVNKYRDLEDLETGEQDFDVFGCKIEDGKLLIQVDYERLSTETAESTAIKQLSDTFEDPLTLRVAVVTDSSASSLKSRKEYQTTRELGTVNVIVERKPIGAQYGLDEIQLKVTQGFVKNPTDDFVTVKESEELKPLLVLSMAEVQGEACSVRSNGYYTWPTTEFCMISSNGQFGMRTLDGERKMHYGIDIAADRGSPVLSAAAGTVQTAAYSDSAGFNVVLRHDNGDITKYFHMQDGLTVREGHHIDRGTKLGIVGNTGHSKGYHLHFEWHENGKAVDPESKFSETPSLLQFTGTFPDGDDAYAGKRNVRIYRNCEFESGDTINSVETCDSENLLEPDENLERRASFTYPLAPLNAKTGERLLLYAGYLDAPYNHQLYLPLIIVNPHDIEQGNIPDNMRRYVREEDGKWVTTAATANGPDKLLFVPSVEEKEEVQKKFDKSEKLPGVWHSGIKASWFGCEKNEEMASGKMSKEVDKYAALPSTRALNTEIEVQNDEGNSVFLTVLDVGPWYTDDHEYVLDETSTVRPKAELMHPEDRKTNGAGIDLSCDAFDALGFKRDDGLRVVRWRFKSERIVSTPTDETAIPEGPPAGIVAPGLKEGDGIYEELRVGSEVVLDNGLRVKIKSFNRGGFRVQCVQFDLYYSDTKTVDGRVCQPSIYGSDWFDSEDLVKIRWEKAPGYNEGYVTLGLYSLGYSKGSTIDRTCPKDQRACVFTFKKFGPMKEARFSNGYQLKVRNLDSRQGIDATTLDFTLSCPDGLKIEDNRIYGTRSFSTIFGKRTVRSWTDKQKSITINWIENDPGKGTVMLELVTLGDHSCPKTS
ncbi:peptidoglycan DD-metalloendopeptidase family protein [Candidatus Micrarchaeota archaeon]|nr:peptidoglycan DD-metalloendopeptidase family protein [Candidatus Micrarchaeota archaeon]